MSYIREKNCILEKLRDFSNKDLGLADTIFRFPQWQHHRMEEIGAVEAVCFSTDGTMNVSAGTQIQFINDLGGNITVTDETVEIDAVRIINN